MTATIFICSLFIFHFFLALLESGIVQKFGFLRSLGVDSFHFGAFSRDTTSTFLYSLWIWDTGWDIRVLDWNMEISRFFFTNSIILHCTFE